MIASVEIRLASMLSALTGAILPAVQSNPFAREQAELLAGHLQVLQTQGNHAEEFERLEHFHTRRLATEVVVDSVGGEKSAAAEGAVRQALNVPVPQGIAAIRVAQSSLAAVIADFVTAQGVDGSSESIARSNTVILAAEYVQSLRNRSYFSPFGYEAGTDDVKPIEQMMNEFRAEFADIEGASA